MLKTLAGKALGFKDFLVLPCHVSGEEIELEREAKCLAKVTWLLKHLEALERGPSTEPVVRGRDGGKCAHTTRTSAAPQGFSAF